MCTHFSWTNPIVISQWMAKWVPLVSLASDELKQLQIYAEPSLKYMLLLAQHFIRTIPQSHRSRTFPPLGSGGSLEWMCCCHEHSHVKGASASNPWELAKPSGLWMTVYERLTGVCRTYLSHYNFILKDDFSLRVLPYRLHPWIKAILPPGWAVYHNLTLIQLHTINLPPQLHIKQKRTISTLLLLVQPMHPHKSTQLTQSQLHCMRVCLSFILVLPSAFRTTLLTLQFSIILMLV